MRFSGGLPETECGAGSTLRATANLRDALPSLLRKLGIKTLLDAPCGDCNWIVQTDLSDLDAYFGLDFHPPHILKASDRIADMARDLLPKCMNAHVGDILQEPWPRCEAVLTRDFLQHWPYSALAGFTARFLESGAEYLLATTFDSYANDDIPAPGMFRPLNLRIAPVNWGEPLEDIDDGDDHVVGLWHRDALAGRAACAA